METVVLPFVLLANGLGAGVMMNTQLGGFAYLRQLPPDRYVHAHAFYSTRYDPFMPLCIVATLLGAGALAVAENTLPLRLLHGLAALLALATLTVSVVKNVPVNKWVQSLDPQRLPPDFGLRDPRRSWGVWNQLRTWLLTAALAVNCVAVGTRL
ncbi:DUF1772 domain-containing protein [Streptomyces albus subsp. chlorinus]|uniref:DUF1772 domain-containing protein n=1 Tax=Streptomyces albus TaxID=1888 RepID=UPI00156EA4AB|nr:DUF1772 domain-containing protein [Streptomyces albus]NSC21567.1 DUF1772 domain-containing protein [Streptomyces albus subsp. chlorinus]